MRGKLRSRAAGRTALAGWCCFAWLALLQPAAVEAQQWQVTAFAGLSFAGDTNLVDLEAAAGQTRLVFGGSGALLGDGPLGLEADVLVIPGFFQADEALRLVTSSRVTTVMGNLVLATPRRWTGYSLRPYVSGGLGLLRVSIEDIADVFSMTSNLVGMNVGAGATGFVSDRVGLRWDLRYFKNLREGDEPPTLPAGTTRIDFWRATMGVVLRY